MVAATADLVAVGASLVAMWVLAEPHSGRALALAAEWARDGTRVIAPCFMLTEVANAVYKRVRRGELTLAQAQQAVDILLGFGVLLEEQPLLHSRAMAIAERLNRPTAYDAHYLALAELRGCEMWTADERLFNAARSAHPGLRWIGNYPAPGAPATQSR